MSSLPTHSTSGSVSTAAGPAVFLTVHGSLSGHALNQGAPPNVPPWCGVNGANLGPRYNDGGLPAVANGDSGARPPTEDPGPLTETGAGSRSPINTDELLIERLEQRLLERESELQDLQVEAAPRLSPATAPCLNISPYKTAPSLNSTPYSTAPTPPPPPPPPLNIELHLHL